MHFTLKYSLARCKYFAFPNPYLRIRMLHALLYILGLVTAMSIQLGPSHPSPNISQLTPSILKSIDCISKVIFRYLTKYLLLCLNGSIQANCCFAHTTSTYVPRSLYTHLDYNDTAHNTLFTWMCDKLPTQSYSVPPAKTLVYCWNVCPSRFLVKMSASLTAPAIHLITSTLASFSSLRNTDWTSMCFVLPPMLQLLAMYTAPWLSISQTIGSLTLSPSNSSTFFI
jgi:hypothetical protein